MLTNIVKFIVITIVLAIATLLVLMVAGALSSEDLKDNIMKVLQVAAIVLVASVAILFVSNKK